MTRSQAVLRMLLLVIALGTPIAVAREYLMPFVNAGVRAFPDANTYQAAGERLNAGHELFRREPGDRAVLFEDQFPAAILSPPPIAVLWRPLAALPWGFDAWVLASWVALLGTIAYLVLKTGLPAALLTLVLSIAIGQQLAIANVTAFFPAVLVIAWRFRHVRWVGVGIGLISAIKLTPIAMTGWMVGGRLWRMLAVTIGTVGVLGVIGGLGAGFDSYFEYLRIAPQIKPSPDSIAGLTGISWASYAVLGGGMVIAVLLGPRWPKWSFAVAVVASTIGTPVIYPIGLVPLLALAAPLIPERAHRAAAVDAGTAGAAELRPG
jgi:Glycosyltransferase family 87